jgi:hypothetical protein
VEKGRAVGDVKARADELDRARKALSVT